MRLLMRSFGRNSRSSASRMTRARVSGRSRPLPFNALDAVPTDTPAARATSRIVGRRGRPVGSLLSVVTTRALVVSESAVAADEHRSSGELRVTSVRPSFAIVSHPCSVPGRILLTRICLGCSMTPPWENKFPAFAGARQHPCWRHLLHALEGLVAHTADSAIWHWHNSTRAFHRVWLTAAFPFN